MNIKRSTQAALFVSIVLSLIVVVVFKLIFHELEFTKLLCAHSLIFLFSFTAFKIYFQSYIINHIKKIYNIIYQGEITVKEEKTFLDVEEETLFWKKEQQKGLDSLQKQNEYRKEFIGNLSHELKTPLFSIQGYIETLLAGGLYDKNINVSYLKKANDNVKRLSAIIQDVDTIAKVESDALNLNKSTFNLIDLINEQIESLELIADKNDIKIEFNEQSKVFKVIADRKKIITVFANLMINSIKYGKEDGTTKIQIVSLVDRVLIEISDDGIGIKKEQLSRIFERFYRVDSNRSRLQGGSGLGLAIVKHIIEAHQQTINVKSEYGKGTCLSFTLESA